MKVGIILPLAEDEKQGRALSFEELRDRALQAEALGFDSIWLYDHLLHRFEGSPPVGFWECWTMLSALAAATNRIEIGTQVLCTAFRNPALIAKMADTLQEVSGGRLTLGLGCGWHEPEFEAFGLPFDHRVSRFEEALQIIVPLLREGHVDFEGKYYSARDCELRPRGSLHGAPPIMVASFGPRMMRLTARHADAWNTDWLGPVDLVEKHRTALQVACAEVGREAATLELTGGITIAYPDLGELPRWQTGPDQYLGGSAHEVAAGLRQYKQLGIAHVMCAYYPNTAAALKRLGEALHVYRAAESVAAPANS